MNNENKARVDSWSYKEDEVLTAIVIRCVGEGETQIVAFQRAAYRLNRTEGACAFRWNNVVRQLPSVRRRFEEARNKGRLIKGKLRSYAVSRDEAETWKEKYKADYESYEGLNPIVSNYADEIVTVQNSEPVIPSVSNLKWELTKIAMDIVDMLVAKNADYGDSFYDTYKEFGDVSVAIRLSDKTKRLTTLSQGKDARVNESIEDVYADSAGYNILALYAKQRLQREEE